MIFTYYLFIKLTSILFVLKFFCQKLINFRLLIDHSIISLFQEAQKIINDANNEREDLEKRIRKLMDELKDYRKR